MAGRRGNNPATGDNRVQEEAEDTAALSPRTSTVRLLAVEDSLGDLHRKIDRVMDNFELLARRMDELRAPPQLEAEMADDGEFNNRRRQRGRGNFRNLHNPRYANRGRADLNPPPQFYADVHNEQEDESSSSDDQNNPWDALDETQRGQHGRRFGTRAETHHDFKMKVDLPSYSGKRDIESFLDWLKSTENFFSYMDTPEQKKVRLVALKLKGGASAWWEQLEANRQRYNKRPVRSWEKMKKLLKERFLPPNYEQTLYNQYQNCRQGTRTVTEYIEEFHRLSARTNLSENEQHQIARFVGGLRFDIKEKVRLQPLRFLSEAISLAETVEEMIALKTNTMNRRTWEPTSNKKTNYANKSNDQPMAPAYGKGKETDSQTATYEKKAEMINRSKNQNNYTRPSLGKCFRCGQPGHLSNSCPQRKTIALADEEDNLPGEGESEPEEETEEIEADEGDRISCVIHRVLIAPKEEKSPQRHSLFKTRCTINGKVCNVIIDGGSSENFITKKIVSNLNLKVASKPLQDRMGQERE